MVYEYLYGRRYCNTCIRRAPVQYRDHRVKLFGTPYAHSTFIFLARPCLSTNGDSECKMAQPNKNPEELIPSSNITYHKRLLYSILVLPPTLDPTVSLGAVSVSDVDFSRGLVLSGVGSMVIGYVALDCTQRCGRRRPAVRAVSLQDKGYRWDLRNAF